MPLGVDVIEAHRAFARCREHEARFGPHSLEVRVDAGVREFRLRQRGHFPPRADRELAEEEVRGDDEEDATLAASALLGGRRRRGARVLEESDDRAALC
jgi:hypothetical protein